jgi:hypothetical protein
LATEKQIAANRANAQKSTGPKTAAGKLKSSRNAYRHGLSCPFRFDPSFDPLFSTKADAISRGLMGEGEREYNLRLATEFVLAQLELQRTRSTRTGLMETFDPNRPDVGVLLRLAALDRYERYAHTKRRRASAKLEGAG